MISTKKIQGYYNEIISHTIQSLLRKYVTHCSASRTVDLLPFSPFSNDGVSQGRNTVDILIPLDQLNMKDLLLSKVTILRLIEDFTTRESSNEHEFFVAVTSLNKIGEGRIWDLNGDVPFPLTFKCIMLIVVASLNKIGEGRIQDHTAASCLISPKCKSIMLQKGLWLKKPVLSSSYRCLSPSLMPSPKRSSDFLNGCWSNKLVASCWLQWIQLSSIGWKRQWSQHCRYSWVLQKEKT